MLNHLVPDLIEEIYCFLNISSMVHFQQLNKRLYLLIKMSEKAQKRKKFIQDKIFALININLDNPLKIENNPKEYNVIQCVSYYKIKPKAHNLTHLNVYIKNPNFENVFVLSSTDSCGKCILVKTDCPDYSTFKKFWLLYTEIGMTSKHIIYDPPVELIVAPEVVTQFTTRLKNIIEERKFYYTYFM